MLHDYLWAIRLGELNDHPLSENLRERIERAGQFLLLIQDEISGGVPCYGQNDGALILPLNSCDHRDFRPATQAVHYWQHGFRCHPAGPWDEDLLWLFGSQALSAVVRAAPRSNLRAEGGGCYTLRNASGFAMVRCPRFRHRPSHADLLHVDVWWQGENVALLVFGVRQYCRLQPL